MFLHRYMIDSVTYDACREVINITIKDLYCIRRADKYLHYVFNADGLVKSGIDFSIKKEGDSDELCQSDN